MTDQSSQLPGLTDGVVTLRPFDESDIAAHVAGEDQESRLWFGQPGPSTREGMHTVVERWRGGRAGAGPRTSLVTSCPPARSSSVRFPPRKPDAPAITNRMPTA